MLVVASLTYVVKMDKQEEFELRPAICPYVCSSPNDFEVEREFLSEVIFPKISQFCQERGAQFNPFDISWSEKDKYFQNGHLLHFLLEFANKCSPYLICLLGERYGPYRLEDSKLLPTNILTIPEKSSSLDKNFLVAALSGHSWILEPSNQTVSILELEIMQAAFLGECEHCNFYFRQSEHIQEKLAHLDKCEYEDLKLKYSPENEDAGIKVNDLKQRIVKKGLTVKYFKTINELGVLVLEDWKAIINLIYPPLYNNGEYLETEEYREWVCQQCFAVNCLDNYIGSDMAEDIMNQLTTFALSKSVVLEQHPEHNGLSEHQLSSPSYNHKRKQMSVKNQSIFVVCGDRGVGKSTLITKWLETFRDHNPDILLINHFIGCSENSMDIATILRQFIAEIKKTLRASKKFDLLVELVQAKTFQELSESFLASVSSLPCLLVVDGLDELGGSLGQTPQEVKEFGWLPNPLPAQCKIIFTTSRSDLTYRSLSKRPDVKIVFMKTLFDYQQKQLFLIENMKHNYPRLTKQNLKQIQDIKLSDKPLFLRLLTSEMLCYHVYTNLNEYLDGLYELCSVREFWMKSLKRWVTDYSWTLDSVSDADGLSEEELETTGWVPDVLRLIILSRSGLTQSEILDLLHQLGYTHHKQVTVLDWLTLRECLKSCLREEKNGLIKFSHHHLSEVAEYTLFRSIKQAAGQVEPTKDTNQRRIFHQQLAVFFLNQPFTHRQLDELPWQLLMAGNFDCLIDILTHEKYLPCLLDEYMKNPSDRFNLIYYWSVLIKHGYSPVYIYVQYLSSLGLTNLNIDAQLVDTNTQGNQPLVTKEVENYVCEKIPNTDRELSVIEENENESKILTEKILSNESSNSCTAATKDICVKSMLSLCEVVSISWHVSQFLLELGYKDSTLKILAVLADFLHKNRPFGLFEELIFTRSLECVGNLFLVDKNYKESYVYYKKSLRAVLQLDDSDDERIYETEINVLKGNILSQLGKMKMVDGNFYEAEDLYQESLKCFGNLIGNQFMKANIEYNLGILRFQQGDYDNSEVFLRESMSIREKQCGRCNILISDNLIALARLLSTITNLDGYDRQEAECLYRRALAIREKCLGGEGLLVAEVLFELGELVGEDTSYQAKIEATSLLSRALDIKTKNLGGDHQDTKVIQSLLTSVEVSIKLGQYQFGPAKPTDKRSKNYPYSNLSFRDKDLKDLSLKEIDRRNQNRLFMTRSHSWDSLYRNATPYSAISFISASEKVLLENQRPYLVKREIHTRSKSQSVPPILKSRELPSPVTCLTTLARRQLNAEINLQDIMEKELKATGAGNIGPDTVVDNYASRVNSPPSSPQPPEVKIFRVTRPFSAPITLSNRYNTLNHKLLNNRYSLKKNRPISSALSTKSVPLQPISGESYHASHCLIPGPHSIHISNTTSVLGPNSSIDTLLGPPVAPRDVARQIHHKSAWYHVHGRYSTPEKEYPAKRSQTRPGSAFSMITTSNHGKLHSREFNHNQRSQSAQEILYDVDEYNNVVTKPASFKEAMTVGKIDICS